MLSNEAQQLGSCGESPRPLVIWHGLGDSAHADGINEFIEDIKGQYPGIFVHSVSIPTDGSADEERKAGFVSLQRSWDDLLLLDS